MVALLDLSKSSLSKSLVDSIVADHLKAFLALMLDRHDKFGISPRLLNIVELIVASWTYCLKH